MILATAGHIDHGKTALVRALTGVDADRLPEEKRRGLTIDLGFAYASLPDGTELGFVDVPGHERFLPNMLAGVLSIDRVLLIVAADDGPRPQTLEHLDILELIEVSEVTGVVTKIDRVPPERAAAVAAEVRMLLAAAGFSASPVFEVSSRTGDGIAALAAHLGESARNADLARASASAPGLFRMPIDRVFTLPGVGLVVTGTAAAGVVRPGDRLTVSPGGEGVRVRALHSHNRPVTSAAAGERCAVNIVGAFTEGGEPSRGAWLAAAERHAPTARLDLKVRVSRNGEASLREGLLVHLHLGTADVVGRLATLAGRTIPAGESGFVQLDLDRPIGALHGDRAVLRDHGSRRTLAGGRVVDPFAPRRGRRDPARLAALAAMAVPDHKAALGQLVAAAGRVDLARFALVRNLAPAELNVLAQDGGFRIVGTARAALAVDKDWLTAVGDRVLAVIETRHRAQPDVLGMPIAALHQALRDVASEAAVDTALAELAEAGRVARQGPLWRLSGHQPRLGGADEKLWQSLLPLLAAAGLRPPRVREMAAALELEPGPVERLLTRAERLGLVSKVAENRFFLPQTLARLAEIAGEVAAASPGGAFTAASFNDRSGVGRNLTIRILEYLDQVGVTRRQGDVRIILRGAEVFG